MRTVTYQPAVDDLIAAYRRKDLHRISTREAIRNWTVAHIFLFTLLFITSRDKNLTTRIMLAIIVVIVASVISTAVQILVVYFTSSHMAKKIFAQQRSLHSVTTVTWSDSDIIFSGGDSTFRLTWSEIGTVLKDRKNIILFPSDFTLCCLPLRVLTSAQVSDIMEQTRLHRRP